MTEMYSNVTIIDNIITENNTIQFVRWQHWSWIVPEVLNIIFTVLTIWILYSLVHYGNKSKKWVLKKERNFEKLNAGLVLMAAVLCAVMALLRFMVSQLAFNIGFSYGEDEQCEIVSDASIVIFCLALFAVYIYLWVRQSVFYTNHMLNTEFSKCLRFFSYLSILLIFLGGLGAIFVNTIPTNYHSSPMGCVYEALDSTLTTVLVLVSALVFLIGQIILVGLLIHPLRKHSKQKGCLTLCGLERRRSSNTAEPLNGKKGGKDESQHHRSKGSRSKINRILRRTVFFSVIIVVSNVAFLVVSTYAFNDHDNRRIPTMLYDISTFASLVFVVSSIGGWTSIMKLTPPVYSVSFVRTTPRSSRVDQLKCNSVILNSNSVHLQDTQSTK